MKAEGYSIKDLEIISGVKAHTIRIWEKRYGLLVPSRTDTNIRYYSDADLRRILNVSLLVNHGFKISKVARFDDTKIKDSVIGVYSSTKSEDDYVERLILYMLNFDNIGFYNFAREIISKMGFADALVKVFYAMFERIGAYWQVGSIFPAQEHYVSNLLRQIMCSEIDKIDINQHNGSTVLFFLREDELHEIGLLFYYYLARKMGYNVIYLGQMVPFEDLAQAQNHVKIDYIFTSFVNAINKEELEEYLVKLKQTFQQQKVFITGWQVQNNNPALPRNVKVIKDYHEFNRYLGKVGVA
jgi:DNA-binding transcriptional MerR regulator